MCIKENYNKILESKNIQEICDFMEQCENEPCIKYGSCDYLGCLDDRLKELEGTLLYYSKCGSMIRLYENELSFFIVGDFTKQN